MVDSLLGHLVHIVCSVGSVNVAACCELAKGRSGPLVMQATLLKGSERWGIPVFQKNNNSELEGFMLRFLSRWQNAGGLWKSKANRGDFHKTRGREPPVQFPHYMMHPRAKWHLTPVPTKHCCCSGYAAALQGQWLGSDIVKSCAPSDQKTLAFQSILLHAMASRCPRKGNKLGMKARTLSAVDS